MSFGAPGYLWLLVLVPLLAAAGAWWLRWRSRARSRFGASTHGGSAPAYALALLIAAVAAASLAAARPQFGSRETTVEDRGIDVVFVLDVSQSMVADDVQPTRLARAQREAAALLERMRGDRVGLVIFAKQPFVRSPLTSDLGALRVLIDGVGDERGLVPPGSDLGAAVRAGQRLLADAPDAGAKVMIIISDGEDHGAGVAPAVGEAARAGVRIYTAGTGTVQGSPVRDADPATLELHDRIDDSGAPVMTRLDAQALATIAAAGGGRYINISGSEGALAPLASELRGLARTTFGDTTNALPIERFQWYAAAALLLAAIELSLPLRRRLTRAGLRRAARLWPLAGAGLLIGAMCAGGVAQVNRDGNRAYNAGDFDQALAHYRTAEAIDPSRPQPYHNAGNAFDRNGDYNEAIDETKRALDAAATPGIEALAEYALGNHYAGAGRLEDAREAYKRALLANPNDQDAKHNLEVIDAMLHPTPTPTPRRPEATPPGGEGQQQGGTPGPGGASGTPAAGQPGTPSPSDQQPSQDDLQRQLAEALQGIDQDLSREEALRILDLLERQNRRAAQEAAPASGAGVPDY